MPTIKNRRATKAQWTLLNSVLAAGEIGLEIDTNKFKIGNGLSTWNALNYFVDEMLASGISGVGYDLILPGGQSNAKGTNTDYDVVNIDIPNDRIFTFAASGPDAGKIVPAVVPLRGISIDPLGGMGIGFPFALQWLSRIPSDRKILIVPVSAGGTGFAANGSVAGRWTVADVAGTTNLFKLFVSQTKAALTAAGPNSRIVAMPWHQGEADSNVSATEVDYANNLDTLIRTFRSEVPEAKDAPFLVGQMAPERLRTQAGTAGVDAAHRHTPARVPLTGFAPSPDGYSGGDNTHFNAAGQRILAQSYLEAYDRAVANRVGIVPSAPKALRISDSAISWDPPIGRVTSYEAVMSINGGAESTTTGIVEPKIAQSFEDTDGATVKVRAVSEAGPGPWAYAVRARTVSSGGGGAVTYPLSDVPLARAYALRKILPYDGPLFRVRRDNDNVEEDFDSVSAATAFVGSASGLVSAWYDQTDNGRDLFQTTSTKQPRLIAAGVLERIGARTAIRFDNVDDIMVGTSAGAWAAGSASFAGVVHGYTGAQATGIVCGEFNSAVVNTSYELCGATTYTLTQFLRNDGGVAMIPTGSVAETPPAFQPGVPAQFTVIDTGSVFKKRVKKTNLADITYTRTGTTTDRFAVNGRARAGAENGWRGMFMGELLVAHTAWDDTSRDKVEAFESSYFSL